MRLRHTIGCACFAFVVAPAFAQDERPAEVIRAPTPQVIGSRAQIDRLLEDLADASEPRVIEVKPGTEIVGVLRAEYGDAARFMWPLVVRANEKTAFYATLRNAGQSLPPSFKAPKSENSFVLPSGPYWELKPSPVSIDKGDTLQTLAVKHMGARKESELRKAQELIRAANPYVNFAKLASQATVLIPERTIAKQFVPTSDVGSFEDAPEFASQGTPPGAQQTGAVLSCDANVWPIDWGAVAAVLRTNAATRAGRRLESKKFYVAVLDSGIDKSEDGRGRFDFWRGGPLDIGVDVSEDVHARTIPPWSGSFRTWKLRNHGTHVAGLVHGGTAEIRSVLRPLSELMILKVISADRTAPDEVPIVKPSSLIAAFNWAVDYEAPILNLSVEPSSEDKNLWGLERYKGSLFVVSAGNGMPGGINGPRGVNIDESWLGPAGFGGPLSMNVVSVAAVDKYGKLARFSNYGGSTVTLAAPGCGLDSYITEAESDDGASSGAAQIGSLTRRISGTSQSTALVTALAAILKSYELSAAEIKFRLISSVDILPCPQDEEKAKTPCLQQSLFAGGIVNPIKALRIYEDLVESNTGEMKLGALTTSTSDPNTGQPTLCFKHEDPSCINLSSVGKISSFERQKDGRYKARIARERSPPAAAFEIFDRVLESDLVLYADGTNRTLNLETTRDIVLKRR